jgi:Voltage-dependent anion channel
MGRCGGYPIVMATGIVALDLRSVGWSAGWHVLLVLAAAAWLALLPTFDALADVAGVPATAVLGTNLESLGWTAVAWCLLAIAAVLWIRMLPRRVAGGGFLGVVATQSLVVFIASLTRADAAHVLGILLLAGGLALYVGVMARFDRRDVAHADGDQWVAGGALAISAVACSHLATGEVLRTAGTVLWVAALAWVPVLVAGELARPRVGRPRGRWSTVFPLGMYAAASYGVASSHGWLGARDLARASTWIALAGWLAVAAGVTVAPTLRR